MKKVIYIATSNKSKAADIGRIFRWIDPLLKAEIVPDYTEVQEKGKTLRANSRLKVLPYIGKYRYPVMAVDTGLFFDKKVSEIQDPSKLKRNALSGHLESEFAQAEIGKLMYEYYRTLAAKHGGTIKCEMRDVFSILLPDKTIKQFATVRKYRLTDRNVNTYDIYHPINSLLASELTGKFMEEMSEEDEKIDKAIIVNAFRALLIL
jgi:hypothetical protein